MGRFSSPNNETNATSIHLCRYPKAAEFIAILIDFRHNTLRLVQSFRPPLIESGDEETGPRYPFYSLHHHLLYQTMLSQDADADHKQVAHLKQLCDTQTFPTVNTIIKVLRIEEGVGKAQKFVLLPIEVFQFLVSFPFQQKSFSFSFRFTSHRSLLVFLSDPFDHHVDEYRCS